MVFYWSTGWLLAFAGGNTGIARNYLADLVVIASSAYGLGSGEYVPSD